MDKETNEVTVYSSRDPIFDCNRDGCNTDHVTYDNAKDCDHGENGTAK